MAHPGRRHLRILASLLLGLSLLLPVATTTFAATTGLRDSGCKMWGSQPARSLFMLTYTYYRDYMWDDFEAKLWTNACGSAAPYGEYRISSKKQIITKFWVTKADVDSCTAGAWPPSFNCSASGGSTTITYNTSAVTTSNYHVLSIDNIWFQGTPSGGHSYMNIQGKTVLNATEDYRVFAPPWLQ
jgi:hypothetical protein